MRRILKREEKVCKWHNDLFALHQDYAEVENEDRYWDSLAKAMGEMSREYHDTDMSVMIDKILIAFAEWQNSKVVRHTMNDSELIAEFLLRSKSKEEIERIIKALQKGVSE